MNEITNRMQITSMEISEVTGKPHCDVLKAIRKMEPAWEKVRGGNFSLSYRNIEGQGDKQYPYYSLTKTECLYIATKFNDEARAKLVLRWEQLEQERLSQQPQQSDSTVPSDPRNLSRLQILQLAIQAEQENQQLREEKQELEAEKLGLMYDVSMRDQQIEQLQEKTEYMNIIMADDATMTTTQIAQDYGMAAVSFNNLLKGLRIQHKVGKQWILYAKYINLGYVKSRLVPIHHAGEPDTFKPFTVWTPLGRKFLHDHLKSHGILPLSERKN